MATDKKASSKKSSKKSDKKVAPKKVGAKKSAKKLAKVGGEELVITVPMGGQAMGTFELTPALPKDGQASEWVLVDTSTGQQVSGIQVSFNVKSSDIEREFERAVLVVNLADDIDDASGHWRFVLNGVEPGERTGDVDHDVLTEITNQGRTLIAIIHAVELGHEEINYGYVASFTDTASGVVSIYESKDPGIGIGRP